MKAIGSADEVFHELTKFQDDNVPYELPSWRQ